MGQTGQTETWGWARITRATRTPEALKRRSVWLMLTLALVMVLAFSACAGRGTQPIGGVGSSGSSGQTAGSSGQAGQSSQAAAVNDLTQVDADLSGIMGSMDSAQQTANIDESANDNAGNIPQP